MPYEESDAEQDSPPWAPRRCLGKENECTIMAAHGTHGARDMDGVNDSANKSKKITKMLEEQKHREGGHREGTEGLTLEEQIGQWAHGNFPRGEGRTSENLEAEGMGGN